MIHSTEQDHEQQPSAPQTVRFGFQGEPGAFGEEAVRSYCSHDSTITPEPLPYRSFADVFRAVATGEVEYGGELGEFLPYLEAGQWIGVGRQTVWGKGEIRLLEVV